MALPHELEFAIWGHEADDTFAVKLAQLDTLVELAVVDLHGIGRFSIAFFFMQARSKSINNERNELQSRESLKY